MKAILLLPVLLVSQLLLSQSGVKIKYHTANIKVPYPALVKNLSKENSYSFVLPEKLAYYYSHRDMQMAGILFPYSDLYIKAKSKKENPDITLVIETAGITNVEAKEPRKTAYGFIIDYTYQLPCKLLVRDNAGSTLYTIEIHSATQTFPIEYIKNMPDYGKLDFRPQYFTSYDEAAGFKAGVKDQGKYIEKIAMLMTYRETAKAITTLFTDFTERHQLQWGDITEPAGVAEYTGLNTAGASMQQAYDLLHTGKVEEGMAQLQSAKKVFEKYKETNNSKIGNEIKTMILYNLGWIYLLTNDTPSALALYEQCQPTADRFTKYGWDEIKLMAGYAQYRTKIKEMIP